MSPDPAAAPAAHRQGFTLIEIVVVVLVIMALMAMLLPALNAFRDRSALRQTQSLVDAVAGAIALYQHTTIVSDRRTGATRRLWYFTGSGGLLDGDPARDESFATGGLRDMAAEAGYTGPARMLTALSVPTRHLDAASGRLVDAWGHPLRVLDLADPASPYHGQTHLRTLVRSLGIWSAGPDGDPATTTDNLTSWGEATP